DKYNQLCAFLIKGNEQFNNQYDVESEIKEFEIAWESGKYNKNQKKTAVPNYSKFKLGDKVRCFRENDFNFTGIVTKIADAGSDTPEWEYTVTNAPEIVAGFPILIWENEITLQNKGETSSV
ncbi:MAG: hypothetical protein NUV97_00005, partial [archaeon]|nr:hypothetical protein [archaeon]